SAIRSSRPHGSCTTSFERDDVAPNARRVTAAPPASAAATCAAHPSDAPRNSRRVHGESKRGPPIDASTQKGPRSAALALAPAQLTAYRPRAPPATRLSQIVAAHRPVRATPAALARPALARKSRNHNNVREYRPARPEGPILAPRARGFIPRQFPDPAQQVMTATLIALALAPPPRRPPAAVPRARAAGHDGHADRPRPGPPRAPRGSAARPIAHSRCERVGRANPRIADAAREGRTDGDAVDPGRERAQRSPAA